MATQGLAKLEQQLTAAPSIKAMFQIETVQERFISNYEAVTGKKDGVNRFSSEVFAYLDIISEKPDIANCDRFQHFKAIIRSATTGLSFRDNKLYIIPGPNKTIKIQSSPAGKREMLEMMEDILQVPEPQLVMKGDKFQHDKMNNRVVEHIATEKSAVETTMDNILAAYVRIVYKDGRIIDTVVYHPDLVKARAKTKTRSEDTPWNVWTGEMCKKVATNRAFRLYHKYPDNVVTFGTDDDKHETEADTTDVEHTVQPQQQNEVMPLEQPAQAAEPTKSQATTAADDYLKG